MTATANSRSGDLLAAIRLDLIDPNDDRVGDEPARERARAYFGRVDLQPSSAHSRASGNPEAARSESSVCCPPSPLSRERTDTKHRFHLIETRSKQPPEWLPTPPAGSVVPFARRRLGDPRKRPATFFVLGPDQRPAPRTGTRERRMRIVAYLALSFVVHGGIYAVLWEKPKPLASIGAEAITVEIVVGAPAGMGIAAAASENEVRASDP